MLCNKPPQIQGLEATSVDDFSSSPVYEVDGADLLQAVSRLGFAPIFELDLGLLLIFPHSSGTKGYLPHGLLFGN